MRLACAAAIVCAAGTAYAAPHMLKGPYLQDLGPTSITIMWQLDEPTAAQLIVDGPGGEHTQDVASARVAEAVATGLQPASRYHYRVVAGGVTWAGEFATAPPVGAAVPMSFVVVGDSRSGTESHRRVIERVSQEAPDFVLGTGDMVDDGAREDQWQTFFDVENLLLRDNVYFPAVGNHDRQGRGRTADTYRAYFAVPDNGGDTERYYAFSYADARFLVLDSNEYSFALTDQTAWIERELTASRQDPAVRHIFVVMHHPPFSVSLHGGQRDLRERWTPLFEKYRVTAVFSGHDHVYERAESGGIHYFVTGGGGAPLYPRRPRASAVDTAAVKRFERAFHYLRVTLTGDRVEVTAVRVDGTEIETTSWRDGGADNAVIASRAAVMQPAPVAVPAAGAAAQPAPAAIDADAGHVLWWGAMGGATLLLVAAVVVVRTLRR